MKKIIDVMRRIRFIRFIADLMCIWGLWCSLLVYSYIKYRPDIRAYTSEELKQFFMRGYFSMVFLCIVIFLCLDLFFYNRFRYLSSNFEYVTYSCAYPAGSAVAKPKLYESAAMDKEKVVQEEMGKIQVEGENNKNDGDK